MINIFSCRIEVEVTTTVICLDLVDNSFERIPWGRRPTNDVTLLGGVHIIVTMFDMEE